MCDQTYRTILTATPPPLIPLSPLRPLYPLLSLQAAQQNRDVAIIEEEGEEVAEEEENQYEMNKEE